VASSKSQISYFTQYCDPRGADSSSYYARIKTAVDHARYTCMLRGAELAQVGHCHPHGMRQARALTALTDPFN
jgi:hypothetical protein